MPRARKGQGQDRAQRALRAAKRIVLVADATKFDMRSFRLFGRLDQVETVVLKALHDCWRGVCDRTQREEGAHERSLHLSAAAFWRVLAHRCARIDAFGEHAVAAM